MIMTDAGITAIESTSRGPLRTIMSWLGLAPGQTTLQEMGYAPDVDLQWIDTASHRERDRQDALIAAHRAMRSAGNSEFEQAETHFTDAFSLDKTLQPSQITNFWQLELHGLEAAGRGLLGAGRNDEAIALASEISYRFGSHPARRPVRAAS